jgi:hypothetical protein
LSAAAIGTVCYQDADYADEATRLTFRKALFASAAGRQKKVFGKGGMRHQYYKCNIRLILHGN